MSDSSFPHCNAEVLHAPLTCVYCDMYPERQSARTASHTPFTPAEANGWRGNVAWTEEMIENEKTFWNDLQENLGQV